MNGTWNRRLAAALIGIALTAGAAAAQTGTTTIDAEAGTTESGTMDPFLAEFAVAWALADSLAAEFDIAFESPTEQLFFVLLLMEVRQQMTQRQSGTTQRGGFGVSAGGFGIRGGGFGGRATRVAGGFDPRPTTGTGTTSTTTRSGTSR